MGLVYGRLVRVVGGECGFGFAVWIVVVWFVWWVILFGVGLRVFVIVGAAVWVLMFGLRLGLLV